MKILICHDILQRKSFCNEEKKQNRNIIAGGFEFTFVTDSFELSLNGFSLNSVNLVNHDRIQR